MTWKLYGRPSEGGVGPSDTAPTVEEGQPATAAEVPTDPLAQLHAEIEVLKTDKADWQDRALRKAAEFENYRKRMERERGEAALFSKSSVLVEIFPVLDACERALESFPEAAENASLNRYREGVELLYKQLSDALLRIGVVPMAALGVRFDPNLHEALVREESSEHEENTVIGVLRRGYLLNDRLIRPAQVRVAVRAPD